MRNEKSNPDKGNDRKGWKSLFKRALWLLLIPFGILWSGFCARYPEQIESIYSQTLYPPISTMLGRLTAGTEVSVAEILAILAVLLIVLYLIFGIVKLFMRSIKPVAFLHRIVTLGIIAGILLNMFYVCWGLNYYRPSLYELMELPVQERSTDELNALCESLAADAAALRGDLNEDGDGVFALQSGYRTYFDALPAAFEHLSKGAGAGIINEAVYPAKSVQLSYYMSYTGIAGIYFPFTGEANVNVDQPPLLLISSAAHEMAHSCGIAAEDEANFFAYLACCASNDPAIQYSGIMLALIHCGNKLAAADSAAYSSLTASYTDGMKRDIADYNAYWQYFEGPVEEFTDELNDSYLRANQQDDGVQSYGMMVDLLLSYYAVQGS